MDRRIFIKDMAVSCTAIMAPQVAAGKEIRHGSAAASAHSFFTPEEAGITGAICQQIVPPDEYPGAKESGAVEFIDGILSGPMGRFYRPSYRNGLAKIENVSHERHGKGFAALPWGDQTRILHDVESGAAAGADGKRFFTLIVQHTMEGYYGDPGDGGNRGGASWRMIKFTGNI